MGKYLDKIRGRESGERLPSIETTQAARLPLLQPGALVSWVRADGTSQEGFVDFLYTDLEGQQWAFLSYEQTWAAVDRRLLTVVTP
jgi:hypothetical protein